MDATSIDPILLAEYKEKHPNAYVGWAGSRKHGKTLTVLGHNQMLAADIRRFYPVHKFLIAEYAALSTDEQQELKRKRLNEKQKTYKRRPKYQYYVSVCFSVEEAEDLYKSVHEMAFFLRSEQRVWYAKRGYKCKKQNDQQCPIVIIQSGSTNGIADSRFSRDFSEVAGIFSGSKVFPHWCDTHCVDSYDVKPDSLPATHTLNSHPIFSCGVCMEMDH